MFLLPYLIIKSGMCSFHTQSHFKREYNGFGKTQGDKNRNRTVSIIAIVEAIEHIACYAVQTTSCLANDLKEALAKESVFII